MITVSMLPACCRSFTASSMRILDNRALNLRGDGRIEEVFRSLHVDVKKLGHAPWMNDPGRVKQHGPPPHRAPRSRNRQAYAHRPRPTPRGTKAISRRPSPRPVAQGNGCAGLAAAWPAVRRLAIRRPVLARVFGPAIRRHQSPPLCWSGNSRARLSLVVKFCQEISRRCAAREP